MKSLAIAAALGCLTTQALAVGKLADLTIIDQQSGQRLTPHYYRGEYWVAGTPGHRYALQIRSQAGQRLMAVTSVDGVNVITGDTASWNQSGYVFSPRQEYQIDGWRKSDTEVAAFEFVAAPASYAARTGRAANIGVIGLALFRERELMRRELAAAPSVREREDEGRLNGAADAAAASSAPIEDKMARAEKAASSTPLGTGHGQRQYSEVERTDFERASDRPDEIVRVRYDSMERLIAMGVIAAPRKPSSHPNPFPDAPLARYVPDPPTSLFDNGVAVQ